MTSRCAHLAVLTSAVLCLGVPAAGASGPTTLLASTSSTGRVGNGPSWSTRVSADGRWAAYSSEADDLVAGDRNGTSDVFRKDLRTGATVRVSAPLPGRRALGSQGSVEPALSADGSVVAFVSDAGGLVTGAVTGRHLYVRDMSSGTTALVDVADDGTVAAGGVGLEAPALSADGRRVAFVSTSAVLVPGDTNGTADVFVRDLVLGTTVRVDVTPSGGQADRDADEPAISADGRTVAFRSAATTLAPGESGLDGHVYVEDLASGRLERVPDLGNGEAESPALSADGRYVVFRSGGVLLRRDRLLGTTLRVDVPAVAGPPRPGLTQALAVSADGNRVAFTSLDSGLVSGDTDDSYDVFLRDVQAATTTRVSVLASGAQAPRGAEPSSVSISADGRTVGLTAWRLVARDRNAWVDAYVRRLG